ncbi:MAG: class I SAM-dependent methyltransferase [Pirellulaceae bacterium]|nr:class I SAM-dependent methyltransferase [Pirellulaceae bacterium]
MTSDLSQPVTPAVPQSEASCWVCGHAEAVLWKARNLERELLPEDFSITDRRYGVTLKLFQCQQCHFIYADGDEVSELITLYEQLEDESYEKTQPARALQMRWLLDRALKLHPQARSLIDIGAGAGLLVSEARQRGLEAVGVEPSRSLVDAARRIYGLQLSCGVFPHQELAQRRFDLIMLVDVIEHVSEPLQLLRHCQESLAEGGRLVVVTPDVSSLAARILGRRWWHLRLAHVGYFSSRTLQRAAKNAGLAEVRCFRAKWFFPVEYLAQRLESYLPIAWWNRLAIKLPLLRWCYRQVVPLNLRDSIVSIFQSNQ